MGSSQFIFERYIHQSMFSLKNVSFYFVQGDCFIIFFVLRAVVLIVLFTKLLFKIMGGCVYIDKNI